MSPLIQGQTGAWTVRTVAFLIALLAVSPAAFADDALFDVMSVELDRSMAKLQLGDLEKPYFISYRIEDRDIATISGRLGSITSNERSRGRTLTVEVRVGSPEFDNSNFLGSGRGAGQLGRATKIPLDDNPKELRRRLWLATDAAYKSALENLAGKQAATQNMTTTEEIPDFSAAEPFESMDDLSRDTPDFKAVAEIVKATSGTFGQTPEVTNSSVRSTWNGIAVHFLNSEGSRYTSKRSYVAFAVSASAQAADGLPIADSFSLYGRQQSDLPTKAELVEQTRELAVRVRDLREAPLLDRYNGPVLFEGVGAVQAFAQGFAQSLLGQRLPFSSDPRFQQAAAQLENPFLDKLGARVLPSFLSVKDDPTLESSLGRYAADDDGVKSSPTQLVSDGILETLLTTRTPVRGVLASSGSRRAGGASPSSMFVSSSEGLDRAALKAQLIKTIEQRRKEYGIIVRRLGGSRGARGGGRGGRGGGGGGGSSVGGPVLAYKIYPDGREELVRNLQFGDLAAASFKDIIAVSNKPTVHHATFRSSNPFARSASGGTPLVTWAVPDLLFEDLTLSGPRGEIPSPPLLAPPSE